MLLKQYYLGCLAHASYLVADEETGRAVVVDPQRDVQQYLEDAERLGLTIEYVFLTHFHADFVAGHLELRDAGARIALGAEADAEYDFEPFGQGDTLSLGSVRLESWTTPGHTPEAISILVYDESSETEAPAAVLTGDTLFIGDVGRPDLMASAGYTADDLASHLYDSLQKLMRLPDETLVYPAHGAGSLCGRSLSSDTVSTIGDQRRYNYALQPMSREQFIELVTADQPEAPSYFGYDADMNRRERSTIDQALERSRHALGADEVLQLRAEGAQVLDTRPPVDFAGAHLAGAINIPLDGQFASWAGTLLDRERPIVVVADGGAEEEALTRLARVGYDHVAGFLDGGMLALDGHDDEFAAVERYTALDVREALTGANPPAVIDVRRPPERLEGSVEGSLNIPLAELPDRIEELPENRPLVVHCQSGYRSSIAASLLQAAGVEGVVDMVGGYEAWAASDAAEATREAAATS
jgi:hydroxyacylglutathione hydrolase